MGRRSDFPRVEKDHYRTFDPRALPPLLRHLPGRPLYAEPCAGDGDLIDQLAPHADLAWASTISDSPPHPAIIPGVDVLTVEREDAQMFITNPPWKRPLLHKIIVHLSDRAPTWLLFDAAWINTKQATRFMPRLRKVVSVGRLLWIPGTTMQGKDDVAWHLFDRPIAGSAPLFYGRDVVPDHAGRRAHRICADCGVMIDRFGKWRLQMRNGVAATVHRDCAYPSGPPVIVETPLLDWGMEKEPEL